MLQSQAVVEVAFFNYDLNRVYFWLMIELNAVSV